MQPSSHYLRCHGREIHYVEWGDKAAPPLIMWHGLARTCRDFDDLARELQGSYRIIAPDTLGRGFSQWSPAPDEEYCLAFYAKIAQSLFDQLGIERVVQLRPVHAHAGDGALAEQLQGVVHSPGPSMRKRAES